MRHPKRKIVCAVIGVCALGVASCMMLQPAKEHEAVTSLPVAEGWTFGDKPIIPAGSFFKKGAWNDPWVLRQGDGYVMYLTSSTEEPFKPPVLPFRAVSEDGLSWKLEPKTPLLNAEGTPYDSIETPTVVRLGSTWHMYYTGVLPAGSIPWMAIGHATSKDGITWKHDDPALIEATGDITDWNGYLVAEPGAVVFNDTIYLYFTALEAREGGNPPQLQVIGLATSKDGYHFSEPQPVFGQTSLYPATKGFVGYSTPAPVVYNGRIHLFYDVALWDESADPQWSQVALHHAVSDNGKTGFVQDAKPILTRSARGFPGGEVLAPTVVIENGTVQMWYMAHAGARGFLPEFLLTGGSSDYGIWHATVPASVIKPDK